MAERDFYEILGVSKDATKDEIKKAYRKMAVKFHPDKNPDDPKAEDKFKEISNAYEVLSDEQKKASYDRFGHEAFTSAGGSGGGWGGGSPFGGGRGGFHDPMDIFNEVFGGGGGGGSIFEEFFSGQRGGSRKKSSKRRGSDLRYDIDLTLEEASFGVEKELIIETDIVCDKCKGSGSLGKGVKSCGTCGGSGQVISRHGLLQMSQTCPQCRGEGEVISDPCKNCHGDGVKMKKNRIKVSFPAGIDHGNRVLVRGKGDAGYRGGPNGDLYVIVHLTKHEIFERDGNDLYCTIPVDFPTAALGGEILVPTLNGKAKLKIPSGTQGETMFRMRDKGVKVLNGNNSGDLYVKVSIEVPTKLNSEQKGCINGLADKLKKENSPLIEAFKKAAKKFFK